jgi:4-amino-4-deoxy-L-arabinose transferase-like glycosyltransferase
MFRSDFKQRFVVAGFFALMLALRVVYAYHFRIDDDEPQHLHVVWGWVSGQIPYRDFFDNHGAVFHLLYAPLFSALGPRADILIPMRLAMIPLLAIALWCVYRIGANLFSKNVGIWAAIFTGLYPEFFFTSTEFRTDNLWTVLWLIAMVLTTGAVFNSLKSLMVGFLLGMAFGVTVKTGLMVGAVVLAAGCVLGRRWAAGETIDWRKALGCAATGFLGLLIVPSALTLFFASEGALQQFLYCNIFHNLVPHAQNWKRLDAHVLWFPIFMLAALAAFICGRHRKFDALADRRVFLILVAGSYFTALKTFFPTLTRQDDLPFIPLLVLLITALIPVLWDRLRTWPGPHAAFVYVAPAIAAVEIVAILAKAPIRKNNTSEEIAMVADVLRLTKPSDYVMDAMGETIYRRRPYYYALEAFTRVRIEQGSIKDDIIEKLIETKTPLVLPAGLTKKARAYVEANYVDIGHGLFLSKENSQADDR